MGYKVWWIPDRTPIVDYVAINSLSTKSCLTWPFCHNHVGHDLMNREGAAHKPIGTTAPWHMGERLLPNMSLGKGWGGKTFSSFHA